MPNIYLRLPQSRCQFFRNRAISEKLTKNEPIVFSRFSPEYNIMRNSLTNAPSRTQVINSRCFSHQQWVNMMGGRHPLGGKLMDKRDRTRYLTFPEVSHLCGRNDYNKSINDDYLCIKLPSEVEMVDTVYTVTPSWTLDKIGVQRLAECLFNDFKRTVIEWALSTFDFCTSNGKIICRGQTAMLERFLIRYGITPNAAERDSLRRIIERWLESEQSHFTAYSTFDMQYHDGKEQVFPVQSVIIE